MRRKMIFGIAPGAMGFQARTQASISHRVRAERPLRRNNFPGNGRREVGRPIPNPVFRHTRSV